MKLYVKNLEDYGTKTARIQGLKKLVGVKVKTPWPIKIVIHEGFEEFKKQGKLPEELKRQILEAFTEIRKRNPQRGVYAGRAYYVPGVDNPPGPRSSSVRSRKVILNEVKKLYDFAIESRFDRRKGVEIGVIFYPFINAGDPVPDKNEPDLQFPGGCVTPGYGERAIIEVLYGADEGVQSFNHDIYVVDFEKMKIVSKDVRSKDKSLRATDELAYETVEVPEEYRDRQALTDEVILDIAKNFKKLEKKFGQHRVEFIQQPEGVIYRECVPFRTKRQSVVSIKGKVTVVKNQKNLEELDGRSKMLFVHPEVIANRDMDLLTELAFEVPKKMVVLFPGSASTAHAAILLRERGHQVVYIGQRVFKGGEVVKVREGKVV